MQVYQKYMFTPENINKLLVEKKCDNKLNFKPKPINKEQINNNNLINRFDKLFWTIYKIVKGDYFYENSNNFKTEKDFKIKSIEELRTIKSHIKTYKLRINEIEDQLLNNKKINLEAFFALALLYKLNIFYVWDNKYYTFNCNENSDIYIIRNTKEGIYIEDDKKKIEFYKENYYNVDNLNKQIKSITNYTKEQLLVIAKKLGIEDINSNPKKQQIYEKILTKF
jgi:hypothetical protein